MKQGKLKTFGLIFLIGLLSMLSVYAWTVTLNYPDGVWDTSNDNSVDFNFTLIANFSSAEWCAVYANDTGTWGVKANYTTVANATPHVQGIAIADSADIAGIVWNAYCYNGSVVVGNSTNLTFGMDGNTPSVTLDSPADELYYNSLQNISFKFTPTDSSNIEACTIYHNNSTAGWLANVTNSSVTSDGQNVVSINFTDGTYIWNVRCNDSAANNAWAEDTNRTITVDRTKPTTIKFLSPLNNSYSNDSTPQIAWNVSSDTNFDYYKISLAPYENLTGVTQTVTINGSTNNNTNMSNIEDDGTYYMQVVAVDKANNTVNSTYILYYTLDTGTPTLTLEYPDNGSYLNDSTPDFNITVVDDNPETCVLYLSNATALHNVTANTSILNSTIYNVTSGVTYNITPSTMEDGNYTFNIVCNDSNDRRVNVSSTDLILVIDRTLPTQPNLTILWGGTNNTDQTPILSWQTSYDINFERHLAQAFYKSNGTVAYGINITNQTINYTEMILLPNHTYNFSVTAYDQAGNLAISYNSTETTYFIDSICGNLTTGWNLCGAVWTTSRNLTRIGNEVDATFVTVWNASDHQWVTCVHGVSASGCGMNVSIQNDDAHAVWIYVNSSRSWDNRTWEAVTTSSNITLTNYTNGWNLEGGFMRGGRSFGYLGDQFEMDNVTMFSMRYDNATTVPFVNKLLFETINNLTNFDYGRGMWIYYNGSGNLTRNVSGW